MGSTILYLCMLWPSHLANKQALPHRLKTQQESKQCTIESLEQLPQQLFSLDEM